MSFTHNYVAGDLLQDPAIIRARATGGTYDASLVSLESESDTHPALVVDGLGDATPLAVKVNGSIQTISGVEGAGVLSDLLDALHAAGIIIDATTAE